MPSNAGTTNGTNRTGIATAPKLAESMLKASQMLPSDPAEAELAQNVRNEYARNAEATGSIPPLGTPTTKPPPRGKAAKREMLFGDKLGERLAFERMGVRIYQGLIGKLEVFGSFPGGPSQADLEEILEEELLHFQELERLIKARGGDPTAVTPSANLAANVSKGICDVIGDPRTTLIEGLEAVLVAELADNDCWQALAELAAQDEDGASELFLEALADEREHLEKVRAWIAAAQGRNPAPAALED